jgi:hypothetical protein
MSCCLPLLLPPLEVVHGVRLLGAQVVEVQNELVSLFISMYVHKRVRVESASYTAMVYH